MSAVRGLVLHVEVGTEAGTDGWFHNPSAKASAHFGVAKDGTLHQWVDTADKAWAEAAGNPYWLSVETEGYPNEPLTAAQIQTSARLLAWAAGAHHFPIQVTDSVTGYGFGVHSMGGDAWGGHTGCPGALRAAQRPEIVRIAQSFAGVVKPMYDPPVVVGPIVADAFVATKGWYYQLDRDGWIHPWLGAPVGKATSGPSMGVAACPAQDGRVPAGTKWARIEADGGGYTCVSTTSLRFGYAVS
jgi:hypothetical protein